MNLYTVFCMLQLLGFFNMVMATNGDPIHSTRGDVSINCGATGGSASRSGREWVGDAKKELYSMVEIMGSSTTSTVVHHKMIIDPVPYKTARLSHSRFTYAFQVSPGQKVLRLHFNASPYKGYKRYKDLFAIEAGPFILLSNFSASLTAKALGVISIVKEFCINIEENNQLLNVVFSPSISSLRDTYAFINGIEIVAAPATRSYFHMEDDELQFVGKSHVHVNNNTALEIIRRVSVKHDYASSLTGATDYGFGTQVTVHRKNENKVQSVTWNISVHAGFRYLVRLHFSRIGVKVAEGSGFPFEVQINGKTVHTSSDQDIEKNDDNIDWYADYLVALKGGKNGGVDGILIGLHSNDEFLDRHGALEGFEILKLSNFDNSLASPNPLYLVNNSSFQTLQILYKVLGHRNAIASGALILLVFINVVVNKWSWTIQDAGESEAASLLSVKARRLCRQFSLAEIQLATHNFSAVNLIGKGGFGKVYKGTIDKGQETVAIKRLKSNSRQGAREFLTEIETLTELRHVNLVSLIGYCYEFKEMILVYEYMASGTLADHLFKLDCNDDNCKSLTWKQRLTICIGAGRGLDYLHTGRSLIHRDVKASNILLDEHFTAKVADFGLAKPLSTGMLEQSHVSTKVKGTFGYWDPEYIATGKLTRKSDTYSFGVVLLEVLSGRRASDPRVTIEELSLTRWAKENISKGNGDHIVLSGLRDEVSDESMKTFLEVVERCLHDDPKNRPTMAEVVVQLQVALELQKKPKNTLSNEKSNLDDNHGASMLASNDDCIAMPSMKKQLGYDTANVKLTSSKKDRRIFKKFFKPTSREKLQRIFTEFSTEFFKPTSSEKSQRIAWHRPPFF